MNFLSAGLAKFEKGLAIVLIFCMAVFMTTSVLFRYFLNAPLSWVGEISIFLLIWITFIGGSLGLKYKSQASVTILLDNVPFFVRKILQVVGHVIMIVFLLVMLYYSLKWITSSGVSYQRANSINIPMWIPYTVVPLGFACAFVHITANLTTIIKEEEVK
ncbi:TRAP transporter small permease [Alteribacter aurantiacus]|uniref:TRAP transporter small permease n=1 Tax=Alteribacter aurantiacus TaxID=254410 RepID=UPI000479EF26|nr:TRAP transporter small permease [Alteribacter aurantiacus]